jgi:uncharacterized protein with beta-barrel porin domain
MRMAETGRGSFVPDNESSIALAQAIRREAELHAFAMATGRGFRRVSALAALALMGLSESVAAQPCIGNPIQTNQTCTNSVSLIDTTPNFGLRDNGTLTVTNTSSGLIQGAQFGIFAAIGANVTNTGNISGGIRGIQANGGVTVANYGSISGGTHGILGFNPTVPTNVTNWGTITGGTSAIAAINGVVGIGNVTNYGTISSTVSNAIQAGSLANVTNFGVITSGGSAGVGVNEVANVTNAGSISGAAFGIYAGTAATVVNTGTIAGAIGIRSGEIGPGAANITNSGTISGTTAALFFSGASDTLTLLPGSKIVGPMVLGGGNDTINFRTGNQNLTFDTLAGATVTGTVPFAVVGNQAVAVDPTPFAMAGRNLVDFTRGISEVLRSVSGAAMSSGTTATAFAPGDGLAGRIDDAFAGFPALGYAGEPMVFKNATVRTDDGRAVWARGLGGHQRQDADGALLRSTTTFGGGAAGVDIVARPDLRFGVFMGGGFSRFSIDTNADNTKTDTVFGGLYGRYASTFAGAPSFFDFALHGGYSGNSTSRSINNNLAPGGIEVASASYNSGYLTPELAYNVNLPLWAAVTLTPSVRLRYVAGFFGGYTESGSTANLAVGSRTIHVFEQRGELKLTHATMLGGRQLLTSVHVGVLGTERVGDTTVNTVVLGASLPFVTPGKDTVAGVLGGGAFEWRTGPGVSLYGAAEAIGMSDSSTVVTAKGGIRAVY